MALADKTSEFATTRAGVASSTSHHIAVSKYPMLTVLTNSANTQWSITNSGFKSGVTLIDVLSDACDTVQVVSDGSVTVAFKAGAQKAYLPTTSLNSAGPCGTKTQASSDSSSKQDSGAFRSQTITSSAIVSDLACALAFFVLA
ncbi:hypothetical protein FRC04_001259 [Tulasnella sp. 424]|nr:hypothetical protein FRC04_001259 [Tulasnella sp. 424]KAG8970490.1 hypothetical protein FRC05_000598 [Tulasnella sp. 425]